MSSTAPKRYPGLSPMVGVEELDVEESEVEELDVEGFEVEGFEVDGFVNELLHVQRMADGWLIVKVTVATVPEEGTLPEPVHPVQRYWVPFVPEVGDVMTMEMAVPLSNQPLEGVDTPYAELTVK